MLTLFLIIGVWLTILTAKKYKQSSHNHNIYFVTGVQSIVRNLGFNQKKKTKVNHQRCDPCAHGLM